MITGYWDMEQDRMILVTLGHLLPLYSPYHQKKIRILNKRKKIAGDIIVLHKCAKTHIHIIYGSWDTEWDLQKFLFFWLIFYPFAFFTPLTIRKNKFLKKMKLAPAEMLSLYMFLPKMAVTWCMVPEIWIKRDRFLCHFGTVFALIHPLVLLA